MMFLDVNPMRAAAIAACCMQPVDRGEMGYLSTSRAAWVPLPDPGGPRRISLMAFSPQFFVVTSVRAPECRDR